MLQFGIYSVNTVPLSPAIKVTVPFICLSLPYITMIATVFFELTYVIDLIEFMFEFSTLHSCFNTLAMIISIGPYKRAIFSKIPIIKHYTRPPSSNRVNVIPLRGNVSIVQATPGH